MPRPPRPWFRFYSEALESRKVQKLKPVLFKHWVNLMCLANVNNPRGTLPDVTDIAFRLRLTETQVSEVLDELNAAALIDGIDGVFVMHDWQEWQPDRDVAPGKRDINHANVTETPRSESGNRDINHDRVEEEKRRVRKRGEEEEIAPLASRRPIFVLYDNYMGKPSVTVAISEQLKAAEEEYPPECIEHCFQEAAASSDGRRSWAYVLAILKRHAAEGCNERPKTSTGNGRRVAEPSGLTASERASLERLGIGAPRVFVMD